MGQVRMRVAKNYNGNLASISDVDNGKKCNCFCIDCEQPVIAKNNRFNIRTSHFAHEPGYICTGNIESYLHKVSKAIICNNNVINLTSDERFEYSEAIKEYSLEEIRPDVFLIGNKNVIIEIYVKSKKKLDYYQKIKSIDIDAYEIDLSKLSYDTILEEIEYHVLTRTDNKNKLNVDSMLVDSFEENEKTTEINNIPPPKDVSPNYWPELIFTLFIALLIFLGLRKKRIK